jgi:hypothetical protein
LRSVPCEVQCLLDRPIKPGDDTNRNSVSEKLYLA